MLDITHSPRARVLKLLRSFDRLPADQQDSSGSYAHRVALRDALADAGHRTSVAESVREARQMLGVIQ